MLCDEEEKRKDLSLSSVHRKSTTCYFSHSFSHRNDDAQEVILFCCNTYTRFCLLLLLHFFLLLDPFHLLINSLRKEASKQARKNDDSFSFGSQLVKEARCCVCSLSSVRHLAVLLEFTATSSRWVAQFVTGKSIEASTYL